MKKAILSLTLMFCLALGMCTNAVAVHSTGLAGTDEIQVVVNGQTIVMDVPAQVYNGTTYVSYAPVVNALISGASIQWLGGQAVVTAPGLDLRIPLGTPYLQVNGCFLAMPQNAKTVDGIILVPIRVLGDALGADVQWDAKSRRVLVTGGAKAIPTEATFYNQENLYWLSHIIYAESGNQPLSGKIAVGNVVLNRVNSYQFPGTVKGVIFQRNQFTPVSSGSIYREPNAESVLAAKLCLSGVNTVGGAIYFLNPRMSPNSWVVRNRPCVATIGAHAFYI